VRDPPREARGSRLGRGLALPPPPAWEPGRSELGKGARRNFPARRLSQAGRGSSNSLGIPSCPHWSRILQHHSWREDRSPGSLNVGAVLLGSFGQGPSSPQSLADAPRPGQELLFKKECPGRGGTSPLRMASSFPVGPTPSPTFLGVSDSIHIELWPAPRRLPFFLNPYWTSTSHTNFVPNRGAQTTAPEARA
jgi:hypothetical protein